MSAAQWSCCRHCLRGDGTRTADCTGTEDQHGSPCRHGCNERATAHDVTIERVDKRAFEKAFNAGARVAIVKDPNYWKFYDNSIGSTHTVPGPVGFTNDTARLEDVYADGPSRPGEAFRFWIVTEVPHE